MKSKVLLLVAALALGLTAQLKAAYINIDDSDLNTITISAGDFERGFYVDGSLLTSGLGAGGSITLADGGHSMAGNWIDLGGSSGALNMYFAHLSSPTWVTSGLQLTGSTDGFIGNVFGSFGGYTGFVYGSGSPTFDQDGGTQFGSYPYLSISFTPESAPRTPDSGATLALIGGAFLGLAAFRRRFVS